jgi:hypothetical protein
MISDNTIPAISFTLRECLELWAPLGASDEAYRLSAVFRRAQKYASTGNFVFSQQFGYDHLPHKMTVNNLLRLITLPQPTLIFKNDFEESIFIDNDFSSRILYDYLEVCETSIGAQHPIENLAFMLGQIKFSSPQISWIRTIVQDIISLAKYSPSPVASHPAYCLFCYRTPRGNNFCEIHDSENNRNKWDKGWREFIRVAENKLDLNFAYPLIPESSLRNIQGSAEPDSLSKPARKKSGKNIFITHFGQYIARETINRALWSCIKDRSFKRNSIVARLWGVLKVEYTKSSPDSVNASDRAWEAAWRYEKLIQKGDVESSQKDINLQEKVLMNEMQEFLVKLSKIHNNKTIHSIREQSFKHTRWDSFIDSITASDCLDDIGARDLLKQYPQTVFGTIERFIIHQEYFLAQSKALKEKPGPKLDKNGLTREERNEIILAERNIDPFISARAIHKTTGIGRDYIRKFLDSLKR